MLTPSSIGGTLCSGINKVVLVILLVVGFPTLRASSLPWTFLVIECHNLPCCSMHFLAFDPTEPFRELPCFCDIEQSCDWIQKQCGLSCTVPTLAPVEDFWAHQAVFQDSNQCGKYITFDTHSEVKSSCSTPLELTTGN